VLGARLGEATSQGYRLLSIPAPEVELIHVHASAEELGRVFQPTLGINAAPGPMAAALAALPVPPTPRWAGWSRDARAEFTAWREPEGCVGAFDLGAVMLWLRDRLPDDAILTVDAGNFAGWGQRFLTYRRPGRFLGPTNGAMGYGVPAAVAAKLVHPGRLVVGMVGDGGFQMTGQELASAMQAGAAPVLLVFNNGLYGTIRMHQERRFPGRVSATTLVNPDFAAVAQAHGAFGRVVSRTEEFAPAFEDAVASGKPAVLDLRMDAEQITTRTTLTALRDEARRRG
ncbi:MAG TPA: thiamine pyrophosphate-dependent enzyme, partial [Azospirillaceae bacterium]|nr:thiamine pyrophosphate-dependent enzyme [Azospirillaceae bacterium]